MRFIKLTYLSSFIFPFRSGTLFRFYTAWDLYSNYLLPPTFLLPLILPSINITLPTKILRLTYALFTPESRHFVRTFSDLVWHNFYWLVAPFVLVVAVVVVARQQL